MSTFEQKPNTGALFSNKERKAENPRAPDYKGSLNVGGVEYWISSWLNTAKDGSKYMALRIELKGEKLASAPTQVPIATEPVQHDTTFDSDIPF